MKNKFIYYTKSINSINIFLVQIISKMITVKTIQQKKSGQEVKQKLALALMQKQLQLLKLKEYLILIGFISGAALLRVPMQVLPSVEPLTFFALLAGWLFGKKKGAVTGASSLYLSNFFVFGGHGPWTIFQAIGFGAAGFFGGFLRKKATVFEAITIAVIATLVFEIVVNIGSVVIFPLSIFSLFLTALPFTLVHLISNIIFASFLPWAKKFVYKKGGFDERQIISNFVNRISSSGHFNWLFHSGKATSE